MEKDSRGDDASVTDTAPPARERTDCAMPGQGDSVAALLTFNSCTPFAFCFRSDRSHCLSFAIADVGSGAEGPWNDRPRSTPLALADS